MQRIARLSHPEVREIVPSHHCVVRFRQRRPVRFVALTCLERGQ
jgi:hypothetical protein